jgi:hypothetical protein
LVDIVKITYFFIGFKNVIDCRYKILLWNIP